MSHASVAHKLCPVTTKVSRIQGKYYGKVPK